MPSAAHNVINAAITGTPPTVSFTSSTSGLIVTVNCGASYGTSAPIVSSLWEFGDGATGTGVTETHTYSAAGSYAIRYTATQADGQTATTQRSIAVTAVVSGGSSPTSIQGSDFWGTTSATQGIPQSVFDNAVTWETLYGQLSAGEKTSQDMVANTLNKLTSSKVVILPNGFDATVYNFNQASGTYALYHRYLQGFICAGGPTQARIKFAANSISPSAVQASGTTQTAYGRIGQDVPVYVAGLTFEGSSQAGVTMLQGISSQFAGANSIWQNVRILGAGYSNNEAPPGETFAWQETRSTNMTFRYSEIDGRLNASGFGPGDAGYTTPIPDSATNWVSGMFGVNGATNITLSDSYLHHAAKSGLTFSLAGVATSGTATNGVTTNRVHVRSNDGHGDYNVPNSGSPQLAGFTGFNHEGVHGQVTHNNPVIEVNNQQEWGDGSDHMIWTGGDNLGYLTVNDPIVGATPGLKTNGYFVVRSTQWWGNGTTASLNQPTVTKNGVRLTCIKRTGNSNLPVGASPNTHWIWNFG